MLPINRKITTAFVVGVALTAGIYFWYRRKKRNCNMEHRNQGKEVLVEDPIPLCYGDKEMHRSFRSQYADSASAESCQDKQPTPCTHKEDKPTQSNQMSDIEEVLNDTKLMVLKHMFLVTEGMTASERLKVYEKLTQKIKVIQRAEGLYDVKWRP